MLCCAVLSCSVVSDSFDPMDCSLPGSSVLGDSPCKNTGVGYDALLQGIFPTQGSNPVLCHCSEVLHHLSHQGSPRILEWVAYPFSRGTFWPRNWTGVSCIAGGFFTSWATRKAPNLSYYIINSGIMNNLVHKTFSSLYQMYLWQIPKDGIWFIIE